jgi:hypothetical protein
MSDLTPIPSSQPVFFFAFKRLTMEFRVQRNRLQRFITFFFSNAVGCGCHA